MGTGSVEIIERHLSDSFLSDKDFKAIEKAVFEDGQVNRDEFMALNRFKTRPIKYDRRLDRLKLALLWRPASIDGEGEDRGPSRQSYDDS